MAEFLTTHQTAASIESIIRDVKQKLVLVSPYLQISRTFFDRLKDADERGVKTVLIYREDKLKPDDRKKLELLKNLSLFSCKYLHAKCYFNEDNMVITSMNMYEYSEKNNKEMGVLIRRQDDVGIFKDAMREVQAFYRSSVKDESKEHKRYQKPIPVLTRNKRATSATNTQKRSVGNILLDTLSTIFTGEKLDAYCIRCGDRIPFDQYRPLCDECYWVWSDYGDPDYPEHYCHSCGKHIKTTKGRPLCHSCYTNSR